MAADLSENIRVAGRQLATREMWQGLSNCRVFVSAAVVEEASAGAKVQAEKRLGLLRGFVVLEVDGQTQLLAARLLERKAIPAHCPEVAVHIACAAVNQVDFLLTWNFKHINNPFMEGAVRAVVIESRHPMPVVCSPEEFLEAEHE